VIMGVDTTIPLLQEVISSPDFIDGTYDNHWLENFMKKRSA